MPAASFVQSSFLGGEVSKSIQGRFDHPGYRTWLNVCLNSQPLEQGTWVRRPGSRHLGTTRGGTLGRVIAFDFKESSPYTMEFTSGFLRFRAGPALVMTNDQKAVVSISAANPAKVLTATHGWATGNQVAFNSLGANNPLLQNRLFTITVTSATEFTLADAITGVNIDGATLGAFVAGNVSRVLEFVTPYTGALWQTLRSIQADIPTLNATTPGAVFLQAAIKPYVLQVVTPPTATAFATFSLAAANFKDGPYMDPVPGGTLATPSALIGNINLTLSFNAYDAARSYSIGDYVVNGGVNYRSLVDANLGSAPPSANWVAVSAADAIGPNGFQVSDIGRLVRLFSEPPIWAVGTAYVTGNVVAYAGTYWKALANNTGVTPNTAPTIWALFPTGAIWTWGKITALSNIIDRALAGSVNLGDMTAGGGLAAAFNGVISQVASASAEETITSGAFVLPGGAFPPLSSFVGKNYTAATDQVIAQAIVYPSSDQGLAFGSFTHAGVSPFAFTNGPIGTAANGGFLTLNLRGKASAPASPADGTLLGTTGPIANTTAPVTIISTDQVTAWKFVWVEIIASGFNWTGGVAISYTLTNAVAELAFLSPAGTGSAAGVTVQIIGDALLYTTAIRIWRLGIYSDTTGWPTCGTYHEGRLWLSGAVNNRIDSSKSNDPFNFAPTNPDGSVSGNNGITYTFNAPDVNPIFWMDPDDNGIVCGTQAGEWLVRATSNNVPLTPTTIQAHRVTKYGCANIEPRHTGLTLAVVQTFKRTLLEYFPDVYSGKFSAHDIAFTAKHLVGTSIEELGYQNELIPTIWARCGNGSLIGVTYARDSLVSSQPPDAAGWHRHELGSGRTVESICVGSNTDGTLDALVMVTSDTSSVRHVEMLTNVFTETDAPADAWQLDNAIEPSSTSTSVSTPAPYGGLTINGLWHLNGKTVQVYAAGLDCGQREKGAPIVDFVVANGSITVPYGDGVSAGTGEGLFTQVLAAAAVAAGQVVVGFTYTSDGQIVRPNAPAESGARSGPAFGKLRRNHQYAMLVDQSAGLSIGTRFDRLEAVKFNAEGSGTAMAIGVTFSGMYRADLLDDDTFDGALCWRVTRPLPATICAIGGFLQTKDA